MLRYTSIGVNVHSMVELEREKEERKDAELSVAAFKRQLATLRDKIASVETDIEQYRALIQNLRRGESTSGLRSHFAYCLHGREK